MKAAPAQGRPPAGLWSGCEVGEHFEHGDAAGAIRADGRLRQPVADEVQTRLAAVTGALERDAAEGTAETERIEVGDGGFEAGRSQDRVEGRRSTPATRRTPSTTPSPPRPRRPPRTRADLIPCAPRVLD